MTSVTIEDKAACVSSVQAVNVQCQATVADAEGCFQAFGDKPCDAGGGACTTVSRACCPSASDGGPARRGHAPVGGAGQERPGARLERDQRREAQARPQRHGGQRGNLPDGNVRGPLTPA